MHAGLIDELVPSGGICAGVPRADMRMMTAEAAAGAATVTSR